MGKRVSITEHFQNTILIKGLVAAVIARMYPKWTQQDDQACHGLKSQKLKKDNVGRAFLSSPLNK